MTQDEQKQFDDLRQELFSAHQRADELRHHSSSLVGRLTDEVRLYRGLFWALLALATAVALLNLLQR